MAGDFPTYAGEISDEELTELALCAEPCDIASADAVSVREYLGIEGTGLLPDWYMPDAAGRPASWRTSLVLLAIVATFLFIEIMGLCSTFGQPAPVH